MARPASTERLMRTGAPCAIVQRPAEIGALAASELEALSRLIGGIYDAVLDPQSWTAVLEEIGAFVRSSGASLYAEESITKSGKVSYVWGVTPEYTQSYFTTYIKLNPYANAACFLGVEEQMSIADVMTHDEFRETRFFREWAQPQGWIDALFVMLDKSVTSYAALGLFRHQNEGPVDDALRRRAQLIAPHLRRAVLIGNVIDLRTNEAAMLADTLAGLAAGVFLLRADGGIAFANQAGQAMLDEGQLVRSAGGVLVAADPRANAALHETVSAAGEGDAAVGRKGVAVSLSASARERWLAHVLPLTSGERKQAISGYAAVAAVFVRKASLETPSPMETVARLYRLTPSELRVLQAVVDVGGIAPIADALGISEATVKTHLHHVFQKTGTSRQAELIKLVAGHVTPFDA
jgi:DNA-binding CsgD family transcriptional regulator/PAS domain-containing protein